MLAPITVEGKDSPVVADVSKVPCTATPRVGSRRTVVGVLVVALVLACTLGSMGGSAVAQEAIVIDDPRLDPSLGGVQVDSDSYRAALAAVRSVEASRSAAQARLADADERVASLGSRTEELSAEIAIAEQRRAEAQRQFDTLQGSLRHLAVESYKQGRDPGAAVVLTEAEEATNALRDSAVVDSLARRRQEQVRAQREVIEDNVAIIERDTEDLANVSSDLDKARTEQTDAESDTKRLTEDARAARRTLADWRLAADVVGTDLPLVALDAYVRAANRLAAEQPTCGLRWWGLAGIGKVESGHGTAGGSRLGADGKTSSRIIGIVLDGSNNTAVVGDSDGGALDDDPEFDRAVGPMQFLPGSWRTLGRDGNGDGRADPDNMYDAALAAAGLLCRAGGSGLDTDAGLYRAALGYNASAAYASLVVRYAKGYAAAEEQIIPPPPPTTTTTVVEAPPEVAPPLPPLFPPVTPPAAPSSTVPTAN